MAKKNDIENIPNYEEYSRQKKIGGFACTYDIIPESADSCPSWQARRRGKIAHYDLNQRQVS